MSEHDPFGTGRPLVCKQPFRKTGKLLLAMYIQISVKPEDSLQRSHLKSKHLCHRPVPSRSKAWTSLRCPFTELSNTLVHKALAQEALQRGWTGIGRSRPGAGANYGRGGPRLAPVAPSWRFTRHSRAPFAASSADMRGAKCLRQRAMAKYQARRERASWLQGRAQPTLVTGLADALLNSVPVLAITGQVARGMVWYETDPGDVHPGGGRADVTNTTTWSRVTVTRHMSSRRHYMWRAPGGWARC
ncbi:hypothetical protein COCOBI_17-2520 [Coccomyxa sp. Obi]|nr:hypothetical protein COCOBI_17-2520 [Coccomyxa sp. Obi]